MLNKPEILVQNAKITTWVTYSKDFELFTKKEALVSAVLRERLVSTKFSQR